MAWRDLRYRNYVVLVSSMQSSDHVNEEIDKEVLEVWDTETFADVQQCMHVCLYMCIESVHVCTVHECMLKLIHG